MRKMNFSFISVFLVLIIISFGLDNYGIVTCYESSGQSSEKCDDESSSNQQLRNENYSIQQVINVASEGDTIILPAGHYNEKLTIDKKVNIIGEELNLTFINGDDFGPGIKILADGVYIKNISFTNHGYGLSPNAQFSDNSESLGAINILRSYCKIENCNFMDSGIGVSISEGGFNLINDCNFENCKLIGVSIQSESLSNRVSNSKFYYGREGIVGRGIFLSNSLNICGLVVGTSSIVKFNEIDGSLSTGIHYQDWYYNENYTIISDNKITSCDIGILSYYSGNCKINNNIIKNSKREGIWLEECVDIIVDGNEISDSGKSGIRLDGYSYDIIIRNNKLYENKDTDIVIDKLVLDVDLENNDGDVDNGFLKRNIICISILIIPFAILIFLIVRYKKRKNQLKDSPKKNKN